MEIEPRKAGKCWSCKYCEDVGTYVYEDYISYMRKCTKYGREYVDSCVSSCSDYVWDGVTEENKPSSSSYSSPSSSSSSSYTSSSSSSSSSSYSSSSSGSGCGVAILVILIIVLVALGIVFVPKIVQGIKQSGTSQQATAVVCNVNYSLNLRDAASSNSKVITTIPKGETVQIIELGTEYHLVQYGDYQGYCAAECLEIQ